MCASFNLYDLKRLYTLILTRLPFKSIQSYPTIIVHKCHVSRLLKTSVITLSFTSETSYVPVVANKEEILTDMSNDFADHKLAQNVSQTMTRVVLKESSQNGMTGI